MVEFRLGDFVHVPRSTRSNESQVATQEDILLAAVDPLVPAGISARWI